MALIVHPRPGTVLLCAYEPGFVAPEMVKTRPVVVLTPRLRKRDGLCTVVPLSTTAPAPVQPWHHEFHFERPLPAPWNSPTVWAKCDMLATVGFHRLALIGIGRGPDGKRRYITERVADGDFIAIQCGVLHALNLGDLASAHPVNPGDLAVLPHR